MFEKKPIMKNWWKMAMGREVHGRNWNWNMHMHVFEFSKLGQLVSSTQKNEWLWRHDSDSSM